jgi:Family of unknown function (DUF6527)
MAYGVSLLSKIGIVWRNLRRRRRIDQIVHIESMQNVPKKLKGTLYIVGKPRPKWAIMACPCRCGERIDVNLIRVASPLGNLLPTAITSLCIHLCGCQRESAAATSGYDRIGLTGYCRLAEASASNGSVPVTVRCSRPGDVPA